MRPKKQKKTRQKNILTIRQKKFLEGIDLGLTRAQALERAGYSPASARTSLYLRSKKLLAELIKREKLARKKSVEKKEDVLKILSKIARAKISDVCDWEKNKMSVIDQKKIDEHDKHAISAVKIDDGKIEIKLADKVKACRALLAHYERVEKMELMRDKLGASDDNNGKDIGDDLAERVFESLGGSAEKQQ